jgi:uncharacterized membrane protein YsdA (DUF1294 family)
MPARRVPARRRRRPSPLPFLPVLAFAGYLAVVIARRDVSGWVAAVYLGMSALTVGIYARDKRAAITGAWRTRESTLQAAALLGGWPGAVFAQQFLRHKNRKASFQVLFWLLALLDVAAFVAFVMLG